MFDEALRPVGLKGTQFTLLVAVRLAQEPRVGRMAAILGMDRTTLSRNLRPLERDGLVETTPGRDRRERLLRLTTSGEQRLSEAYEHWDRAQAWIVESLGEDVWNELMVSVRAVHAMVENGATQ